jgi:eukaryotic-like serine/threonine-protein kinase
VASDLTGRQFGSFQMLSLLGAGGMGEVFRARDLTLGREVAIKVVSANVGHDSARRSRFEREARLLASLNHPNIAAIYAVEAIDDAPGLVLELVEGPTLADRLVAGPLTVDETVRIAVQLIDALDAAHQKGVVHRDLKPANIKVTNSGLVKVLDFGLAKAVTGGDEHSNASASLSPTITAGLTREGTILGTSAYMSPEQTRGEAVGRSADVWAFGCVLYEMLTGRRAFPGETISETIAAVLKSEPDWTPFASMPTPLETLVRRCLEKDVRRRLHDIADARIWLEEVQRHKENDTRTAKRSTAAPGEPSSRWLLAAGALAFSVVGFGVGAGVVKLTQPAVVANDAPTLRFEFTPPPSAPFTTALTGYNLVISNDGSQVVYQTLADDTFHLTLRRLDSLETTPVPGSNLARNPFFSPDGKRVGFIVGGVIKTVALENGLQTTVGPIEGLGAATWSDDGTIAFTQPDGLYRVSESGGTPQLALRPDPAKGERAFFSVSSLPGGGLLVGVLARDGTGGRTYVSVLPRGATEAKAVLDGVNGAVYAQGALVYPEKKGLTATRFDLQRNEISGSPIVIESGSTNNGMFAQNGTFAYARAGGTQSSLMLSVALLSPDGKPIKTIADDLVFARHPRVSPDGHRLALTLGDGNGGSIWTYDLSGAAQPLKLTAGAAAELPVWRPDGHQIDLVWRRMAWSMASIPSDGSVVEPTSLIEGGNDTLPQDWSPDGKAFLYQVANISGGTDILEFDLASKKSGPWLQTSFNEGEARFSPDGRWVAYVSDQTGRFEVWARPYGTTGSPVRVSSDGGHEPAWSHDGRTIFYHAGSKMMAATFQVSPAGGAAGHPRVLFDGGFLPYNIIYRRTYDVLPDGNFVVIQRARPVVPESIVVVLNALRPLTKSPQ